MRLSPKYGREVEIEFFDRAADAVAMELLGKLLIRFRDNKPLGGMIVETEAYFGEEDPASRASKGGKIKDLMYREPGYILVYMVHANWLLNIVTGPSEKASAVLIRAIEPMIGIPEMMDNRGVYEIRKLTSGPGKVTKALDINGEFNRYRVNSDDSPVKVLYYIDYELDEIGRSHRIGVSKDLNEPFRFYIKNNEFVSRV